MQQPRASQAAFSYLQSFRVSAILNQNNGVTNHLIIVFVLATILLSTVASPALAQSAGRVFYVSPTGSDLNPGTQSAPWQTIGKAAATLIAGDTAMVLDGTYDEPSIGISNSGTQSNPITIKAQNRRQAILASRSGCNPSMSIHGSWIVIDGLRFTISPNNPGCASPNSATVYIRCWEATGGIYYPSTGTAGCTLRGALMDPHPSRFEHFKSNQDRTLVEDSDLGDIATFGTFGTVFRNNIVRPRGGSAAGIIAKGGSRSFQAYNNIVYQSDNWLGLILGGSPPGPSYPVFAPGGETIACYNCLAYNNVVINQGSHPSALSLGTMGAHNSALFNNVVINGPLTTLDDSRGNTFKNNIVVCNGKAALRDWNDASAILDYNNFNNCSGAPSQAHPINGDPLFVDPSSDWRLQTGSPAIGAGTPVSFTGYGGEVIDVSSDKDGLVRAAPWDIGIHNVAHATAATSSSPAWSVSTPTGVNLALHKPVTASSTYSTDYFPDKAVDGNIWTRWSSIFSDPQYITVDLGATYLLEQAVLKWEVAHAREYEIQLSSDGIHFSSVYSNRFGSGGIESVPLSSKAARYVRVYGTQRGTSWGYSLLEFEVYGAAQ